MKLGMGMMRLLLLYENDFTSIDYEQLNEMVDAYMDAGFNHFDTAYIYHDGVGEIAFKKSVVERYPRESFKIATKLPLFVITEESQLEPIFAEQLKNCGVDYFDYYMLHNVSGFTENAWKNVDLYSFIQKKKEEGYIKHIGLSTHGNSEFLEELLFEHPEIEFVLLQINYLDWEDESIESRKCLEIARKYGKPVMIMEPYKGGFLADVPEEAEKIMKDYNPDRSVVSWAMRFVANLDDVCVVLTGASNLKQLENNIHEFKNADPLNDDELKNKPDVANALNSKANAFDKLDKKNDALEIYKKLNETKPENAIYKLNYALCLYEMEKFDESKNILNETEKLFEQQKNNFEEEIIKKFEKNISKLKNEINKQSKKNI